MEYVVLALIAIPLIGAVVFMFIPAEHPGPQLTRYFAALTAGTMFVL